MGDTSVTMPSACIIYHHATLMRVWEFLSVCVLAQTIEASIPYLGSEDVPSRLQVSLVRARARVRVRVRVRVRARVRVRVRGGGVG